jgi:hypothetical protein
MKLIASRFAQLFCERANNFFLICVIRKFQLRGNNSVCAGAFQLLRGRAPAQLRGNIAENPQILRATVQNSVAIATWLSRFVHPCSKHHEKMLAANSLCKKSFESFSEFKCQETGEHCKNTYEVHNKIRKINYRNGG